MTRLTSALAALAAARPDLGPFEIQHGASGLPSGWRGAALMPHDEIDSHIRRATLVIAHAGPATIADVHRYRKIPIVVPRQRRFREHVDDHQLHFARRLAAAGEILVVEDTGTLTRIVSQYAEFVENLPTPVRHDPSPAVAAFIALADRLDS